MYIFPILIALLILLWQVKNIRVSWIVAVFTFIAIISLIYGLVELSIYTSINAGLREFVRNVVYILLIIITSNIELSVTEYKKIWYSILLFLVVIQIMQLFKFFNINSLLAKVYGEELNQLRVSEVYNIDTFSLFRAGSIFINPNQFSRVLLLIICIIFSYDIDYNQYRKSNNIINIIKIIIIIMSLILAGSRTAFIIFLLLILLYRNKLYFYRRWIIFAIVLIVILIVYFGIDLPELRMIKVFEGINNSVGVKFKNLNNLISRYNSFNFIFGLGPFNEFESGLTAVDFDFGYIFAYYGIFGISFYLMIFYYLLNNSTGNYRKLKVGFLIVIFFSSLTGGILLNLRVFCTFIVISFVRINENILVKK
jgi:hypothetical protein